MVEIEQVREVHREAAALGGAPPSPALRQLGDLRILREVGKGGMGVVYEAEQVSLGRHVALKVLPKSMLLDVKAKRRFEREAKAAARLHHTNIVPVFGVGEQEGLPYYVMQFIEGLGLDEVLEELKNLQSGGARAGSTVTGGQSHCSRTEISAAQVARSLLTGEFQGKNDEDDGDATTAPEDAACPHDPAADARNRSAVLDSFTLSSSSVALPRRSRDGGKSKSRRPTYWRSVASIGIQVADALEYAHKQGVQHRDVKPSNLLLDTHGTVWVTDFGLAKAEDQPNLTHTGDILGTLRYMPPEAFEGKADVRGDVYSLGLTLYEMLTFRPAFDEKERNRLIRQVTQEEPPRLGKSIRSLPRDLETIVSKAIDREPGRRYQTAAELAADLQRFVDDEPIRARRTNLPERSWRWCKRNPLIAGLTAAVFVLLAAVAAIASVGYAQTRLALRREAGEHAEADRERRRAEKNLYHSLVREAQAIRRLRNAGYRQDVWDRLKQALALATPDKDPAQLRQEAAACLGDFVGLAPFAWPRFPSAIRALTVHPDGRQVVVGLADGTILLCDLATGEQRARLHEHRAPVVSLSLAAAGGGMASGDLDGVVKVWRARSDAAWVCTRTMAIDRPGDPNDKLIRYSSPLSVVLSSDGKLLFICSKNQPGVALWDLTRGTRSQTFEAPAPGTLAGLALSPDGKFLAAEYNRDRILVWEVANGTLEHNIPSDVGWVTDLVFSDHGHDLAYAGALGGAVLGGPEFRRLTFARFGISTSVSFSPDEKMVAFVDKHNGAIRLWELATNREAAVLKQAGVTLIHFSKDGQFLVGGEGENSMVRIWDLAAAREKLVIGAHVGGVPSVAFSPGGHHLASAGKDRAVRIWDPAGGQLVHELTGFRGQVETIAFSPDGSLLATGDWAGGIRFWQVPSWHELPALMHPLGPIIWACAFSPDGRYFAACGHGGFVLWEVVASATAEGRANSRMVLEPVARVSHQEISSLAFNPAGNLLAWTARYAPRLHLWDVSNSQRYPFPPLGVSSYVRNLAFCRDGKLLALIRQGSGPELWNVATRQRVYPTGPRDFRGARERSLGGVVALSPDDTWLAVQGAITIWDLRRRELLLALPEEHGANWALAWSPDRQRLAAGFSDGSLVLWNIPRIRAQLAQIGLDWQGAPSPAARPEPAEATGEPRPLETARLFALELFGTAQATLAAEGNVCRVDIAAVDDTTWHARITKLFEDPQPGATYTVRFRAKADAPRRIFLGGFIDEPEWHSIGLSQDVPLTEVWQDYQYEFQAKDLAAENSIQFNIGDQTGTVWIADFTLTKNAK
jgi:serine/threonine protein kinase/WD40 repeat protein